MDFLHKNSHAFRFFPAVISGQQIISYSQLARAVQATQKKLKQKPHAYAAICAPVSLKYIILLLALWQRKVVTCSLDPKLPADARRSHLEQLGCRTFLQGKDIEALVDIQAPVTKLSATGLSLNQNLTLTFTSGSSGNPKAVLHTYSNHYFSALGSNTNIPVKPGDRWLLNLPLYHVSGLSILFRTFSAGGTVIIPTDKDLSSQVKRWRITHLSIVPTQLHNLNEKASLKAVLVGGAPIPVGLVRQSLRRSLPIFLTYGLTETASQVATTTQNSLKAIILPYRNIKISDDDEILVKGRTLFKGYWQRGKIIKATDKNGWFSTGDIGSFKGGQLKVSGRKDNMFISGGENIHPEEIEKQLLSIKGIPKAAVVPVKDKAYGQRPIAFVLTKLSEKAIKQRLRKSLAGFKVPDKFYPWPQTMPDRIKISRKIFKQLAQKKAL